MHNFVALVKPIPKLLFLRDISWTSDFECASGQTLQQVLRLVQSFTFLTEFYIHSQMFTYIIECIDPEYTRTALSFYSCCYTHINWWFSFSFSSTWRFKIRSYNSVSKKIVGYSLQTWKHDFSIATLWMYSFKVINGPMLVNVAEFVEEKRNIRYSSLFWFSRNSFIKEMAAALGTKRKFK